MIWAILGTVVAAFLAGMYLTALSLTAADARRWGRARRPFPTAARHGMRGTLLRDVRPPASVTVPAARHLEHARRSA